MSWINSLFMKTDVTFETAAIRLALSFIAGGLIGLEREMTRQTAGLRTHILVSVGATLIMLVSAFGFADILGKDNVVLDPSRVAAQVVSGIGFLGAAAVLRLGNNIKGITTAASIWAAAAVGLAIGAGLFLPAAIAVGLILVALVLLEALEHRFFPAERIKTINLFFTNTSVDTKKILRIAAAYAIKVQTINVIQELHRQRVKVNLLVKFPVTISIPRFYKDLRELASIYKIEMEENV
jgi:putative Mg2+ transporter-C (MgtC) family protein